MNRILTFPEPQEHVLSIRAKALVFDDPGSKALLAQAERVAATDANVLIVGETGTGKELIARHIHQESGRSGPFIAVNCGAFSETLVEAELFGHESGAYTGATGARAGWFEAAQHGTLFLDEIGDLPLSMQVKLLRVLQERQVVRLGARKPIDLDVRLLAATNIRLDQTVAAGHFRADLYFRLSVAVLELAPLAQRPGDILMLAEHFISVYGRRLNLTGVRLAPDAREALLRYSWPGNIRELENVVHYALIVNRDGLVRADDLRLRGPTLTGQAPRPDDGCAAPPAPVPLRDPVQALADLFSELFDAGVPDLAQRVERLLIERAYAHCLRNQVHTAELLGVTRNVLRTQLKRFGLLGSAAGSSADGSDHASVGEGAMA